MGSVGRGNESTLRSICISCNRIQKAITNFQAVTWSPKWLSFLLCKNFKNWALIKNSEQSTLKDYIEWSFY